MKPIEDLLFTQTPPDIDIIVFPEAVIMYESFKTYIPEPSEKIAPCDVLNYHTYLSELSCYARSLKTYLVFNLIEKSICNANETCPSTGYHQYSSNVVFDRNGTVVSKYRKTHLYYDEEIKFDVLDEPQLETFTTDFGVTFAHFICFDLNFYTPAEEHVANGITDFIYPTSWFQELPFLTALQLHQGWAQANDVNFLSADASRASLQNTGSGIFAGKWGALDYIITGTPTRKMITARVPKKTGNYIPSSKVSHPFNSLEIPPRTTDIVTKRDYNLELFNTEIIQSSQLSLDTEICHNGLCCEFSIKRVRRFSTTTYLNYEYRIGAFNGSGTLQRMDTTEFGICAIFACTNQHLSSCGRIFPSGIVGNDLYFKNIDIRASFKKKEKMLVMPSTVNGLLHPLPADAYRFNKIEKGSDDSSVIYELKLVKPQLDLLTFGLYGNYFVESKWQHNGRFEVGDRGNLI